MSKAFYPTNDGHVGNLDKLPSVEIRELLRRQEDLLKKKSFVAKLADKGEKIRSHMVILQQALANREKLSSTNTENVNLTQSNGINDNQTNGSENSRIDVDTDSRSNHMSHSGEPSDSLENCLDKLSISESGGSSSDRHVVQTDLPKHYYEVALERREKNIQAGFRQPMKLNRDLKVQHVKDLPSEIMKDRPVKLETSNSKCIADRIKVPEESAVRPPQYKYSSAQTIQLQEALFLQLQQKETQETLNNEIAAQKLAERLHIKTDDYNPEGVDMSYRNTTRGDGYLNDVDSDDDNDENDVNNYPMMSVPSDTED